MVKILNAVRAPLDYLSPLNGVAETVQADHEALLSREEMIELGQKHEVAGLVVPGEAPIDVELLEALPFLTVVANTAAGYNNLPLGAMTERGIWGTNTPKAFVDATADATFAILLGFARKIPAADAYLRRGTWEIDGIKTANWAGIELTGKTLGIVGYGNIGKAVRKRAEAFGMRVVYSRSQSDGHPDCRNLDELLAEADFVSLHTPLTDQTRHLIDEAAMKSMKSGAVLINMARGPVVDEAALVTSLKSGHLAGAGLDVFEEEPQIQPELITLENVVLTPHLGGATFESRKRARITACENVRQVLAGETPTNALNQPRSGSNRISDT